MFRATIVIAVVLIAVARAAGQDLDELRKQKLALAREGYMTQLETVRKLGGKFDALWAWSVRWMEAAQDVDPKADAIPRIEAHLERLRDLEKSMLELYKAGFNQVSGTDLLVVKYYRLDAQILLEKAKAKKKG
jgi:hypothetical protein